jgi:hypothetical protein
MKTYWESRYIDLYFLDLDISRSVVRDTFQPLDHRKEPCYWIEGLVGSCVSPNDLEKRKICAFHKVYTIFLGIPAVEMFSWSELLLV